MGWFWPQRGQDFVCKAEQSFQKTRQVLQSPSAPRGGRGALPENATYPSLIKNPVPEGIWIPSRMGSDVCSGMKRALLAAGGFAKRFALFYLPTGVRSERKASGP